MIRKLTIKEKSSIIIKSLMQRYKNHDISAYAALMAFFLTLSLFPFLIVLFSVLGRFSLNTNLIINALELFFPPETHILVVEFIQKNIILQGSSLISVSIFGALWASSRGIRALMLSLNMAYEVRETRNYLFVKLIDIFYTILIIIGIVILLFIPMIGREFLYFIAQYVTISPALIELIALIRIIALPFSILLIIISIYMFMPNQKQPFIKVIPGTLFTVIFLIALSYLFSIFTNYIANFSLIYGSLYTIIILMIWFYITSIILILGGELNSVFEKMPE